MMISLRALIAASGIAFAPIAAGAQQPSPPATAEQLAQITARGRALEAYDQAAWHGSDAGQAVAGRDTNGLDLFIARKTPTGWLVDFGKLDAAGTTFLTVIEASSPDGLHFTAQRLSPARSDTGFLVAAAHASKAAQARFHFVPGFNYNVAVLPNDDGTLYVYLYPAQTNPKIFPVGGDERYKFSSDGLTLLEEHRMHNSILAQDIDAGVPAGKHAAAGWRTVVVENVPQDTDVFHVLARTPPIPDYVSAQGQLYLIKTDGSIEYLKDKPQGLPPY
jgi:hypothetical protein